MPYRNTDLYSVFHVGMRARGGKGQLGPLIVVLVLLAGAAWPSGASANRRHRTRPARPTHCRISRHERVMLRTATGVVSELTRNTEVAEGGEVLEYEQIWHACLIGVWREWPVGVTGGRTSGGGGSYFRALQLVGPYVTLGEEQGSRYGSAGAWVKQYDLRTGRQTFSSPYNGSPNGQGKLAELQSQQPFEPVPAETALVANVTGAAAWIIRTAVGPPSQLTLVVRSKGQTHTVVTYPFEGRLEGMPPVLRSPLWEIAISESEVSWHHFTSALSAPL